MPKQFKSGLFFEKDPAGTVGVAAPAIIVIDLGYYFFNRFLFGEN